MLLSICKSDVLDLGVTLTCYW